MTTALLIIIVLIELARLVLQYRSGKTYMEMQNKTYCAAYKTENSMSYVERNNLQKELDDMGKLGYEIASVVDNGRRKNGNHYYHVFFTKKKIKNFTDK